MKTPESTDWQSSADQQLWFDQFVSSPESNGLKFGQFQEFLGKTLYTYFAKFPTTKVGGMSDEVAPKFTYQQEIQLFKLFDTKNDHLIDREEFAHLCQSWLEKTYRRSCALIVVDVQNDFIDGSLALINGPAGEDGAEVVPVINRILESCNFDLVAYTLDWHPQDHIGFYENIHLRKYRLKGESSRAAIPESGSSENSNSSNSDDSSQSTTGAGLHLASIQEDDSNKFKLKKLTSEVKLFDTVLFDEGRVEQKLWPIHCVQNSWGAQLHPKLHRLKGAIYVEKGTLSNVDAYSAFWDNMHMNETRLRHELVSRKISDVFFCGLALDYCVSTSALDSARAGFVTFVIEDACRGIDKEEMRKRKDEMLSSGILFLNSESINSYLMQDNRIARNGADSNDIDQTIVGDESKCMYMLDRDLVINICYKKAVASSMSFQ